MTMNMRIENIWKEMYSKKDEESGLILQRFSPVSIQACYISMRLPEKLIGIAFQFQEKSFELKDFIKLKGILIEKIRKDGSQLLTISLLNQDLISLFAVLSSDLIDTVKDSESETKLLELLLNRIVKWQHLLEIAQSNGLSPEKQLGLFGELYLLKKLILRTKETKLCIDIWVGPETGIRDFEFNDNAIEVKTSKSHNHQKVTISSERQLDTSTLETLFLYHLSVEKRKGSNYTLNYIISEIIDLIGNDYSLITDFKKKLAKVAYFEHQKAFYDEVSYIIRNESFYDIKGDFPRIEENDLMKGVGDVKYSVVLSINLDKHKIEFDHILKKIEI